MEWEIKAEPEKVLHHSSIKSRIVSQIVSKRLSDDNDLMNEFLSSDLSLLYPPSELKNAKEAAEVLKQAIQNNETIVIHGDYDVDGIMSTFILYKTLKDLGGSVGWFLPNRKKDGYGIAQRFIDICKTTNPSIVVTVDCGITAHKQIEELKSFGIDVIVLDHHTVDDTGIPKEAKIVVDPKQAKETNPFIDCAGVGVVFKVCWALSEKLSEKLPYSLPDFLKMLIPYVGVGTVADVMPLIDENRIIVSEAMKAINEGRIQGGLKYIIEASKLTLGEITARDVAFMVGPRVNSAGRIDDPSVALKCLINNDRSLAYKLDVLNTQRKEISQETLNEALEKVKEQCDIENDPIIVVVGNDWHGGVVGIVAGNLCEEFHKPCIVLSAHGDIAKGSGRSIEGFNLLEAVSKAEKYLNRYGGHAQALGLEIEVDNIDKFRKKLRSIKHKKLIASTGVKKIQIDGIVRLSEITPNVMRELNILEPFGEQNPEPIFIAEAVEAVDFRTMGSSGIHFSALFVQDDTSFRGVGFNAPNLIEMFEEGHTIFNIAFYPVWNTFSGTKSLEIRIKDLKPL